MRLAKNLGCPVIESREVRRKPLAARRLGIDMVFWRGGGGGGGGEIVAQDDRCPHMGAAARIPDALRARTFPAREKHGFVWLWWGGAAPADRIPFFEALDAGWSYQTQIVE